MSDIRLPPSSHFPTWQKYTVLASYCNALSIADKRQIFATLRAYIGNNADYHGMHHLYLTRYGITLGEFALFHTIAEHTRRKRDDREV